MLKSLCLTLTLICFCPIAFATTNTLMPPTGPYIGIQGGLTKADEGNGFLDRDQQLVKTFYPGQHLAYSRGGFGGRVFVGWRLWRYLGVEGGFSLYPNNTYHSTDSSIFDRVKTHTFDLLARASIPLSKIHLLRHAVHWYVTALAGASYVTITHRYRQPTTTMQQTTRHSIRPTYGLGAGYIVNRKLTIDLTYLGFLGHNDTSYRNNVLINGTKFIPEGNMIMLGATWNLGYLLHR